VKKLSTTSHAILALLAIRPWSAYELAQEMRRNVGHYWPRTERAVYQEPKNLVTHGLAYPSVEHDGRRQRTVYTITAQGRTALAQWLSTPLTEPLQLECEAAIRIAFAENGSITDALTALAELRAYLDEQLTFAAAIARTYAEGQGRYPQRNHVISILIPLLYGQYAAADDWAAWAADQLQRWGSTNIEAADPSEVQANFADLLARHDARNPVQLINR
jgi:DNA-binding PadR family transcriptional regulator